MLFSTSLWGVKGVYVEHFHSVWVFKSLINWTLGFMLALLPPSSESWVWAASPAKHHHVTSLNDQQAWWRLSWSSSSWLIKSNSLFMINIPTCHVSITCSIALQPHCLWTTSSKFTMSFVSVLSRDPISPNNTITSGPWKLHYTHRCVSQEITALQTSYLILSVIPMILSSPPDCSKVCLWLSAGHYHPHVISHPLRPFQHLFCLHFVVLKCQKIVWILIVA